MKYLLLLLLISPQIVFAETGYPGLPPDCWTESKHVHGIMDTSRYLKEKLKVEKVTISELKKYKVISPNKAYSFEVDNPRGNPILTIYAEKDHITKLNFKSIYVLLDTKWINEKLIFMRIMWGRLASTDAIFDVEKEEFIYAESVMDGGVSMQQARDFCKRLGGCKCIEKE